MKSNKRTSGLRAYINGKINYNQFQNIKKINYKSLETFKTNLEEEKKAKKYYSEKSKSIHGLPLFKEESKMIIQKNSNNKSNLDIDNYLNINTSPSIDSNNKFQNNKFENISLSIQGSETSFVI